MVREAAALGMEEIVPLAQRLKKAVEAIDIDIAGGLQSADPGVEGGGIMHAQRFIRPECGQDACRQAGVSKGLMMPQVIGGIIGCAEVRYFEFLENALGGQL